MVVLLSGCGASPTTEDFATIRPAMTLSEVENILGKGTEVFRDDPDLPGIYIPTPEERAATGSSDQRWIKWVIDGKYLLVGVKNNEVFMVNHAR